LHDLHKYPLERLLGAGGMGCVFLCRNKNRLIPYTRVVVKCFWEHLKGTLDEVFKEPLAMRDIAGDYIPEPLDIGYADTIKRERAYFVTAYIDDAIDGEAWLEKYGPLDLEIGLQVGLQIAKGLQIAHAAGICHLDLKPANILLLKKTSEVSKTSDVSVSVKIIDFGLSQTVPSLQQKAMTMQQNRAGLSQFGKEIFGTLDYACPEQQGFTQYGKPGVLCDVFAFGMTMYRFFTGKNPRYVRERDLPKVLRDLLGDCVEENPELRPESARQLINKIEIIQGIEPKKAKKLDENAWQVACQENTKSAYRVYLDGNTLKQYADDAEKQLQIIEKSETEEQAKIAQQKEEKKRQAEIAKRKAEDEKRRPAEIAQKQLASYRYIDNCDGTVTDNRTGLIWLKNANCFGRQDWKTAMQLAAKLAHQVGLIKELASKFKLAQAHGQCGLSDGSKPGDWRLPTKEEWKAMVDDKVAHKHSQPALSNAAGTGPWKEEDAFSGVQSSYYWSSTTYAYDAAYAWYVNLGSGNVSTYDKTSAYYVWPVRRGH
jgi:serine/threonine protein kinase